MRSINALAAAFRAPLAPGERLTLKLVKEGREHGQGVGYLDDGTMVVVEQARPHLNQEVEFTVTRALQTSAGRMIFGRLNADTAPPPAERRQANPQSASR